jgi:hypothetical protein
VSCRVFVISIVGSICIHIYRGLFRAGSERLFGMSCWEIFVPQRLRSLLRLSSWSRGPTGLGVHVHRLQRGCAHCSHEPSYLPYHCLVFACLQARFLGRERVPALRAVMGTMPPTVPAGARRARPVSKWFSVLQVSCCTEQLIFACRSIRCWTCCGVQPLFSRYFSDFWCLSKLLVL